MSPTRPVHSRDSIVLSQHAHSPTAQRAIVAQMLDHARQAVCSGSAREGELILSAPLQRQKVGTWQFEE
jgi:hypothetical protein